MTPALTPEEWAEMEYDATVDNAPYGWQAGESGHVWTNITGDILYVRDGDSVCRIKSPGMRHAVAALCLYDHPNGFTQSDVQLLRDVADNSGAWTDQNRDRMTIVAAKIAALLPPETP